MSKQGRGRRSPEMRVLLKQARAQQQQFKRALAEKMKLDALKEAMNNVDEETLTALQSAQVSETISATEQLRKHINLQLHRK